MTLRIGHILVFAFTIQFHWLISQETKEDIDKQAKKFFESESYVEATPLYLRLLSLEPRNPNYNYRYGTCLLYNSQRKDVAFKYLNYAVSAGEVELEAYYFLGRAYHLTYQFKKAIINYQKYADLAGSRSIKKLDVNRQIEMCNNGLKLLNNISETVVLNKQEIGSEEFFRIYELDQIGGELIITAEFQSKIDKKYNHIPIIHFPEGSKNVYYSSYGDDEDYGKDIYFRTRLPDNSWSLPQKIRGQVNTYYDEDFPYLSPNGQKLFFSSKGHNSMGGYDIFQAEFDGENFNNIENLDFSISSPDDDMLYIVDNDEKNAFFASKRESEDGKIHVFKVLVDRYPVQNVCIKGFFYPQDQFGKSGLRIQIFEEENQEKIGEFQSDNSGEYILALPKGGNYRFILEYGGNEYQKVISIPKLKEFRPLKQNIKELVTTNSTELLIENLFDELFADPVTILADLIQKKAILEESNETEIASNIIFDVDFSEFGLENYSIAEILEMAESKVTDLEIRLGKSEQRLLQAQESLKDAEIKMKIYLSRSDSLLALSNFEADPNKKEFFIKNSEIALANAQKQAEMIENSSVIIDFLEKDPIETKKRLDQAIFISTQLKQNSQNLPAFTDVLSSNQDFIKNELLVRTITDAQFELVAQINAEIEKSQKYIDNKEEFVNRKSEINKYVAELNENLKNSNKKETERIQEELNQLNNELYDIDNELSYIDKKIKTNAVARSNKELLEKLDQYEVAEISTISNDDSALLQTQLEIDQEQIAQNNSNPDSEQQNSLDNNQNSATNNSTTADNKNRQSEQTETQTQQQQQQQQSQVIQEMQASTLAFEQDILEIQNQVANGSASKEQVVQRNQEYKQKLQQDLNQIQELIEQNGQSNELTEQQQLIQSQITQVEQQITQSQLEIDQEQIAQNNSNPDSEQQKSLDNNQNSATNNSTTADNQNRQSEQTDTQTQQQSQQEQSQQINSLNSFLKLNNSDKIILSRNTINIDTLQLKMKILTQLSNQILAEINSNSTPEKKASLENDYAIIVQEKKQVSILIGELEQSNEIEVVENILYQNSNADEKKILNEKTAVILQLEKEKEELNVSLNSNLSKKAQKQIERKIEENENQFINAKIEVLDTKTNISQHLIANEIYTINPNINTIISRKNDNLANDLISKAAIEKNNTIKSELLEEAFQLQSEAIHSIHENNERKRIIKELDQLIAEAQIESLEAIELIESNEIIIKENTFIKKELIEIENEIAELNLSIASASKKEIEQLIKSKNELTQIKNELENALVINENKLSMIESKDFNLKDNIVEVNSINNTVSFKKEVEIAQSENYKELKFLHDSLTSIQQVLKEKMETSSLKKEELSLVVGNSNNSIQKDQTKNLINEIAMLENDIKSLNNSANLMQNKISELINQVDDKDITQNLLVRSVEPIEEIKQKSVNPITNFQILEESNSSYSENNPIPIITEKPKGLVYKVQIGAFSKPVPNETFAQFTPVDGVQVRQGLIRYSAGRFGNKKDAASAKDRIRALGYADAFVVAYCDGERIPLYQADEMIAAGTCISTIPSLIASENSDIDINKEIYLINDEGEIDEFAYNKSPGAADAIAGETKLGLYFTVQVGVYNTPVSSARLFNISPLITMRLKNGQMRYSSGMFDNLENAKLKQKEAKELGIADAFIVAYYKGERITVSEANNLLMENGNQILESVQPTNQKNNSVSTSITVPPPPPSPILKDKPINIQLISSSNYESYPYDLLKEFNNDGSFFYFDVETGKIKSPLYNENEIPDTSLFKTKLDIHKYYQVYPIVNENAIKLDQAISNSDSLINTLTVRITKNDITNDIIEFFRKTTDFKEINATQNGGITIRFHSLGHIEALYQIQERMSQLGATEIRLESSKCDLLNKN